MTHELKERIIELIRTKIKDEHTDFRSIIFVEYLDREGIDLTITLGPDLSDDQILEQYLRWEMYIYKGE